MPKRPGKVSIFSFYCVVIVLFLAGTLLGNKAVETVSAKTPIYRKNHIVIDPGHGGEDGGAVSCSGKSESTINLQISLRLDDLLHLMGYDTRMIRKNDTAVYTEGETISQKKVSDLKNRVRLASEAENSLLLSIHQNSFPEEKYYGAQVFYAKTSGSKLLADEMQAKLIATLNPGSRREAKQGSGIFLLEKIKIPGVLVECGFLSNIQEEARLRTPEYQKQLCCVIASVTAVYLTTA